MANIANGGTQHANGPRVELQNITHTPAGSYCTVNGRLYIAQKVKVSGPLNIARKKTYVDVWSPGPDVPIASLAMGANRKLAALTRGGELFELHANGQASDAFPSIQLPQDTSSFAVSFKGSVAFTSRANPGHIGYLDYKDRLNGNADNIVWIPRPAQQGTDGNQDIRSMTFTSDGKLLVLDQRNSLWEGHRTSNNGSIAMQWQESRGLEMHSMPPVLSKKLKKPHPKQALVELKKETILSNGQLIERRKDGQAVSFQPITAPAGTYNFARSLDGSLAIVSDRPEHRNQIGFLHHQYRNEAQPTEYINWIDLPEGATDPSRNHNIRDINFSFNGGIDIRTANGNTWKSTPPEPNAAVGWHSGALLPETAYDFAVSAQGAQAVVSTDVPDSLLYTMPAEGEKAGRTVIVNLPEVHRRSDGRNIGFMSFDKNGMLLLHDTAGRRWRSNLASVHESGQGNVQLKWEALQPEVSTTRPRPDAPGKLTHTLKHVIAKANPQLPVVPPAPQPVSLHLRADGQVGGLDASNRPLVLELNGRWSYAEYKAPNALFKFFKKFKRAPAGDVAVNGLGLVHGAQNWIVLNRSKKEWLIPVWATKRFAAEDRTERWKNWFKGSFEHVKKLSTVDIKKDTALARAALLNQIARPTLATSVLAEQPDPAKAWINARTLQLLGQLDHYTGTLKPPRTEEEIEAQLKPILEKHFPNAEDADAPAKAIAKAEGSEAPSDANAVSIPLSQGAIRKHYVNALKKTDSNAQKLAAEYHAPPEKVNSNENVLYVLREARRAMGMTAEQDPILNQLDGMLGNNKFLAFDGIRHTAVEKTDDLLSLSLKSRRNKFAALTAELLLLHAFQANREHPAGENSNDGNQSALVLVPDSVDTGTENAPAYKLVKKTSEEVASGDIVLARNATDTMADTAFLLHQFVNEGILDLKRLITHTESWDFMRGALEKENESYRMRRLLTGQYLLGVEPSQKGLAGTYGVKDSAAAYRQLCSFMPPGATLDLELSKVFGIDLEGSSLFFKTGAHEVTKAASIQTFAIEPISALARIWTHKLQIVSTADDYTIAVGSSKQFIENIVAAKIQMGIGISAKTGMPSGLTLIAFAYAGWNTKLKLFGYAHNVTTELRLTIPKDDVGGAEATVEKVMSGKLSLPDMLNSNVSGIISKHSVTHTITFNLDFEPLLASGVVVVDKIDDKKNFLFKYIFAPAVLQVNFATKKVTGLTATVGNGGITLTYHDATDHEIFATYIGVHEFQTNAGQQDPDGSDGPVREFDPQQKFWLPFFGIIHLQKKLLGKAVEQDGFSMTLNAESKEMLAAGFTLTATPPKLGQSKGIKALREQYLDTNEDITEEMIPTLKELLRQHPGMRAHLEKLKASTNPVNISFELKPGILAKLNQTIRDLEEQGIAFTLDELTANFMALPGAIRIKSFSVSESRRYETGNSSGLSAGRFNGKGTISLTTPAASITMHYMDDANGGTSYFTLGGSLVESHENAGIEQIERIHREGGSELWEFLQNPMANSRDTARHAARINDVLMRLRHDRTPIIDDQTYDNSLEEIETAIETLQSSDIAKNRRKYETAKKGLIDRINQEIDKKIALMGRHWDELTGNTAGADSAVLRAFFTARDGQLDRVRLLQVLDDPEKLTIFMSSVCRYTGAPLPDESQYRAAGDASATDTPEAASPSTGRLGHSRSVISRLLGRSQKPSGAARDESAASSDEGDTDGSYDHSGRSGTPGTGSSLGASRVAVAQVGGGLPGLGQMGTSVITAPEAHLVYPASSRSGRSADGGSTKYPPSRISRRTTSMASVQPERQPDRAGRPLGADVVPIGEMDDLHHFKVTKSRVKTWQTKDKKFESFEEIAADLRNEIRRILAHEILEENERTELEQLVAITNDRQFLDSAGVRINEVEVTQVVKREQRRDYNSYATERLNAINADTPLEDDLLYGLVAAALSERDWDGEGLRRHMLEYLRRQPQLVTGWASDLFSATRLESMKPEDVRQNIDRLVAAVNNPASISSDDLLDPSASDDLNLAGTLLMAIGIATQTTIELQDTAGNIQKFGIGHHRTAGGATIDFSPNVIRLAIQDNRYVAVSRDDVSSQYRSFETDEADDQSVDRTPSRSPSPASRHAAQPSRTSGAGSRSADQPQGSPSVRTLRDDVSSQYRSFETDEADDRSVDRAPSRSPSPASRRAVQSSRTSGAGSRSADQSSRSLSVGSRSEGVASSTRSASPTTGVQRIRTPDLELQTPDFGSDFEVDTGVDRIGMPNLGSAFEVDLEAGSRSARQSSRTPSTRTLRSAESYDAGLDPADVSAALQLLEEENSEGREG